MLKSSAPNIPNSASCHPEVTLIDHRPPVRQSIVAPHFAMWREEKSWMNRGDEADAAGLRGIERGHGEAIVGGAFDFGAAAPPSLGDQQIVDAEFFGVTNSLQQTFLQRGAGDFGGRRRRSSTALS